MKMERPRHGCRFDMPSTSGSCNCGSDGSGSSCSAAAERLTTAQQHNGMEHVLSDQHVPPGLQELLIKFSIAAIKENPDDLVGFAAKYFCALRDSTEAARSADAAAGLTAQQPAGAVKDEEQEVKQLKETAAATASPEAARKQKTRFSIADSDRESSPIGEFKATSRRKSVSAEWYDPGAESDNEDQNVVHPKSDEQRRTLADAVKDILIFRSLDKEQMLRVVDAMFEKQVTKGEVIIKQGDEEADYFFVIGWGIFEVFQDGVKEAEYTDKGSFGELALMYNTPRARTITAATDGVLWALDRVTFRRIVLKSAYRKRKYYEEIIAAAPLFHCLKEYEKNNLADALTTVTYQDGAQIIKEGDAADCMYFVESGEVSIVKKDKNGVHEEKEVARCLRGQYFGELALLTKQLRAASAFAVGETKCAVIDVAAFERLLGPCMNIMMRAKDTYEDNLVKIFGCKENISDLR